MVTLFIVPEPSAMTPSAAYRAPVIACEVSTFPAATAAGYSGASMHPGGMITRTGLRQPELRGLSSATRGRNTYSTAAMATDDGALKLPGRRAEGPVKATSAGPAGRATRLATLI